MRVITWPIGALDQASWSRMLCVGHAHNAYRASILDNRQRTLAAP